MSIVKVSDRADSTSASTDEITRSLFVDGHGHFHDCFPLGTYLTQAAANFHAAIQSAPPSLPTSCIVILAGMHGQHPFEFMLAALTADDDWNFEQLEDALSFVAKRQDGAQLSFIAAHQVVTREGLELLSIATKSAPSEGMPLHETVDEVILGDGLVVLPWGLGKWLGKRGRLLRQFLTSICDKSRIFLGDNGGRPGACGFPNPITLAAQLGFRVLPGTDPLALPRQVSTIGRYGFTLQCTFDMLQPTASLKRALVDDPRQPASFGQTSGLWDSMLTQLAWWKHKPRSR